MSELAAVLFDMDGTTVETESLWRETEARTMAHFGQTWTEQDQDESTGMPYSIVVAQMSRRSGASQDDVGTVLRATIADLMSTRPLAIQPGITSLLDELHGQRVPTALVSNSWRRLIDIIIARTGLSFDASVGSDEVVADKPAPDPYLKACELLSVDPRSSVVLEDSVPGVQSATSAGCFVVAVPQIQVIEPSDRVVVAPNLAGMTLSRLRQLIAGA